MRSRIQRAAVLDLVAVTTANRSRRLRKNSTDAEKRLWRILRDRRFAGYKFRRQHAMGPYYLDFYCAEAKLAVELDGGRHGFPDKRAQDEERDRYLTSRGILVKRFWNHQVQREPRMVRENLWRLLQERAPHPGNVPKQANAKDHSHPSPWPSPR